MSRIQCERENEVLEACRSDLWTPALREHVSHCTDCGEVIIVAGVLVHEAESAGLEAHLPRFRLILWGRQLAAAKAAFMRGTWALTLSTWPLLLGGAVG